jgi:transposase
MSARRDHAWHRSSEESRRLEQIPGVGPIVATALVSEVGDWKEFSSGRSLAAWIGLVPKQHSTGGKERLGRISKQGNRHAMAARRRRHGRYLPMKSMWTQRVGVKVAPNIKSEIAQTAASKRSGEPSPV